MGSSANSSDQISPMAEKFKGKLTPQQFNIAYKMEKEPSYYNKYCANKEAGLYSSCASGDVLFSSKDKF